jgi:hypothetical protein
MEITRPLLLLLGCAACSMACNSILGLGDYKVSADASSGAGGGGGSGSCAWDPASGNCYPCAPATDPEYLNACTSAACVPFDDKTRITKLLPDGGLPPVPDLPPQDAAAEAQEAGAETGADASLDAADGGGG